MTLPSLDELSDEQMDIFHYLQRDNMHMSNEELLEILGDVCEESYDGEVVDYATVE
jgi:hypothetical protein